MAATDPIALSAVNPVATLIAWYRTSGLIITEFGSAAHVSGVNKAPYPHLRVAPSPGGTDGGVWTSDPEVLVEVYGDIDGTPGQAALRRLAIIAFGVAKQLEDRVDYSPDEPVVSRVGGPTSTVWRFATDPATGQPRWARTFTVTMHPAASAPAT